PLRNLGSLAQPYKDGNTQLPPPWLAAAPFAVTRPSPFIRSAPVCRALVSRRSAKPSQRLRILSRDHAPGKIPALCVATALGQNRTIILIAQDPYQSRPEPLRHQRFRH